VDHKSISEELYGEGDKGSGDAKMFKVDTPLLNLGLLSSNAKVSGFLEY